MTAPAPEGDVTNEPARAVTLLRWSLAAFAFAVAVQFTLGSAGLLRLALPTVLGGWGVGAAFLWRASRARTAGRGGGGAEAERAGGDARTWTTSDVLGGAALASALLTRAWEGLHRTHFTYDVLSYHLHLPAAWRAAGRVGIVPTPFGDQAPAYAPANAELLYELALAATGNVRLAHAGQVPFAALASLAIVATVRTLGASRVIAAGAALTFLLVPEIWQQASGAMSDLAAAAFFLSALPFLVRWSRRPRSPAPDDVVASALALGLLLGTKYVSAVVAVPLGAWGMVLAAAWAARRRLPPGVPRAPERAAGTAIFLAPLLIVAAGGFWYVRNVVMTGNPTFPVTLRLATPFGSWTLARGLYDGAAMRAWTYHLPVTHLQPLLEIFTETGLAFLGGTIIAFGWLLARRRRGWPALFVTSIGLGWLAIPYQQSRFFFAAWGVAAIMMGAAVAAGGPGEARLPARPVIPSPRPGLALAAPIVGAALQFPTAARVVVAGAFALGAAWEGRSGSAIAAIAAVVRSRLPPWFDAASTTRRGLAALAGVGLLAGAAALWTRVRPAEVTYSIGDHHDAGWAFARAQLHGRRVAYAGSNLPLPLWGWRLDNDVRYVNVEGGPDERLLERAARALPAPAPVGAVGDTGRLTSAEPAPERAHPVRDTWLSNLASLRIDTLFLTSLYPEVGDAVAQDDDAFPVERAWADSLPARFTLRFVSPGVRVYDVRHPGAGGAAPP